MAKFDLDSGGYEPDLGQRDSPYAGFDPPKLTAPQPSPFPGGLKPTTPYTGAPGRTYTGANGTSWTDDPNPNSVTGFVPAGAGAHDRTNRDYILSQVSQWAKLPGANASLGRDPEYWLRRITETGGLGQDNLAYWQNLGMRPEGAPENWSASNPWGGGAYTNANPFDDPATKNYTDLLNSRTQSLLTPQQNPELDKLIGHLSKYFEQLQQPVYTDQQRDVLNTQTIDPLERQRQARKQQVVQQLAARGMSPSDGPTIQALQNVDREFDQMRAQYQGQAASNEIGLGRQNQQQAVDIGSLAAQLRNGQFQQQDSRANQAVGYARQIPDMAQQRLQTAIALLNGNSLNANSLMNTMGNFQQNDRYQSQQDQQYWASMLDTLWQTLFGNRR